VLRCINHVFIFAWGIMERKRKSRNSKYNNYKKFKARKTLLYECSHLLSPLTNSTRSSPWIVIGLA
jgi:hypothetical protein